MQASSIQTQPVVASRSTSALALSAQLWFAIALIGQLVFVAYIGFFYWLSAFKGDFASWTEVLPKGLVVGEGFTNAALVVHILMAATITLSGLLQLLPKIRQVAPRFHRYNGRFYIFMALTMGITGLIVIAIRGTVGNSIQHLGTSFNGVLVIAFSILALRYAMAGQIAIHRRWALRLFIVVSGVWFFRVGLMFWLIANQGPVGIDFETFTGPFLSFLSFGSYLVPLFLLECYLRAQNSASDAFRWGVSGVNFCAAAVTAVGIFAASAGMWFPRILS